MQAPPHNIELEQVVLKYLLTSPNNISESLEKLTVEDFFIDGNKSVFEAILALHRRSAEIDIITVSEEINKIGKDTNIVTIDILNAQDSFFISEKILRLKEYALRRQLRTLGLRMEDASEDRNNDILLTFDEVQEELRKISNHLQAINKNVEPKQQITAFKKHLSDLKNNKIKLLKSNIMHIDRIIKGFKGGELYIVAARPSIGKTAFIINLIKNIAFEDQNPVGLISLEMSALAINIRLCSLITNINNNKLNSEKYKFSNDEKQAIEKFQNDYAKAKIFIDYSGGLTASQLYNKAKYMKDKYNISALFVDYIQLIKGDITTKNRSRQQELGEISRMLKQIAMDINIPVISAAQLNREVESRNDKRPFLSDLRESGDIEQDSDVVILLHRPEYYDIKEFKDNKPTANRAEVIIAKNRNGSTGKTIVEFIGSTGTFQDIAFEYDELSEEVL